MNAERLTRRQKVPFLKSLVWPCQGSNPQPPDREVDTLTTRPSCQQGGFNKMKITRHYSFFCDSFNVQVEFGNNSSPCWWISWLPGEHRLKVTWAGYALKESPMRLFSEEEEIPVDHRKVRVRGEGVEYAKVFKAGEFFIDGSSAGKGQSWNASTINSCFRRYTSVAYIMLIAVY